MSRLAFYAPMKPPGHPVPSGDREMARGLIAALEHGGAAVDVVSAMRCYDGAGDAAAQRGLTDEARAEAARLVPVLAQRRPAAWVTYHNYYKAPDLIGPAVCRALSLPYIQIESTRARKRLDGPWAGFAEAAEGASDAAAMIFYLTAQDRDALERWRPAGQILRHLRPFLPVSSLPPAADSGTDAPVLSAAMMRPGDKLASYALIAEVLAAGDDGWRLEIAGDGPARAEVAGLMAPFGARVRFLGRLDKAGMAAAYRRAALFLWPGVNEAFGMVCLEAQAAGLPVVAQDRPGLRDVLAPGAYPPPEAGAAPLAARVSALMSDAGLREREAAAARAHIAAHHLLPGAAAALKAGIAEVRTGA